MITAFTIILSFIGIVISIASLVFAIIFLVKIFKLEKQITIIQEIKEILIHQLVFFSPESEEKPIYGRDCLKIIQEKYNCDELTAIKFYYLKNRE